MKDVRFEMLDVSVKNQKSNTKTKNQIPNSKNQKPKTKNQNKLSTFEFKIIHLQHD